MIARDVPGNTHAVDLGAIRARGVVLAPPDRSIVAGRRVRIGISADARGLRLELARLGDGAPQILARGHAGACRDCACPGRGARRRLRRLQPPRGTHVRDAAGRARRAPARVALLVSRQPASVLLPFQRRLDALGIRFDAITLRDQREGVLDGYKAIVVPAVGGSADALSGLQLVTSVDGIKPGLGS